MLPVVLVINTWLARDREEGRRGKEEGSSGAQSAPSAVAVMPRRGRGGGLWLLGEGGREWEPWLRPLAATRGVGGEKGSVVGRCGDGVQW